MTLWLNILIKLQKSNYREWAVKGNLSIFKSFPEYRRPNQWPLIRKHLMGRRSAEFISLAFDKAWLVLLRHTTPGEIIACVQNNPS